MYVHCGALSLRVVAARPSPHLAPSTEFFELHITFKHMYARFTAMSNATKFLFCQQMNFGCSFRRFGKFRVFMSARVCGAEEKKFNVKGLAA